jgi:hypothetical protein
MSNILDQRTDNGIITERQSQFNRNHINIAQYDNQIGDYEAL